MGTRSCRPPGCCERRLTPCLMTGEPPGETLDTGPGWDPCPSTGCVPVDFFFPTGLATTSSLVYTERKREKPLASARFERPGDPSAAWSNYGGKCPEKIKEQFRLLNTILCSLWICPGEGGLKHYGGCGVKFSPCYSRKRLATSKHLFWPKWDGASPKQPADTKRGPALALPCLMPSEHDGGVTWGILLHTKNLAGSSPSSKGALRKAGAGS